MACQTTQLQNLFSLGRVHAVFSHGTLSAATEQVKSKPNPKFEQSFLLYAQLVFFRTKRFTVATIPNTHRLTLNSI